MPLYDICHSLHLMLLGAFPGMYAKSKTMICEQDLTKEPFLILMFKTLFIHTKDVPSFLVQFLE